MNGSDATSVTVDVTSSTTYKDPKVTSPSFADVTIGEMVRVQGTTAAGVVTATSVSSASQGFMRRLSGPGTPPAAAGTVSRSGPAGGVNFFTLHGQGRHHCHRRRDLVDHLQGPEGHLTELRQRHRR